MTEPISLPGVYDMTDEEYHADPALSSSGARLLLPPSCPALFRHDRDNRPTPSRAFDLGHAAHKAVLGKGAELHVVDAENYQTKAARQERDEAHARGAVPLLPDEWDTVQAMAAVLREHPRAGELFTGGVAEQSLFWRDEDTDVMCRARPDWLTPDRIVDYKTTTAVDLGHISRSMASFGYHVQDVFYRLVAAELGLLPYDAEFLFVLQSKTPPHLVQVVELDEPALRLGEAMVRQALEVFRDCTDSGLWPSYTDDIETVSLPAYYMRAQEREIW